MSVGLARDLTEPLAQQTGTLPTRPANQMAVKSKAHLKEN